METYFVDVILPLALGRHYTYRIPADLNQNLAIGKRVVVQFGKAKIYSAIIARIHHSPPERYEAKYILDVLDPEPIVNQHQLELWSWIADYYMCSAGSVMQAALPSVLKLASETKIIAADLEAVDRSDLSDKEFLILDALEIEPEIKVSDIVKLLGQKTVLPILKGLLEKGILRISEEVAERFKPKKQVFVQLNPVFDNPSDRQQLFESLNSAPRQMDALMAYIHLKRSKSSVSRNELMEQSGCGSQAIKALADKQVLLKRIGKIEGNGASYVWDAIKLGLDMLEQKSGEGRRKAIVLMSDGVDNSLSFTGRLGSRISFADLAERTRTNKIGPDELSGSTISLTNTGSRGAVWDTPIINQPNAAIFATPAIVKRPVVVDDPDLGEVVAVRHMMYGILTYDHRIIDGADAARFLVKVKEVLEAADFEGDLGLERE